MSKLYGFLSGGRGEATRCGHQSILAQVQNVDQDAIRVELRADGTATIYVTPKLMHFITIKTQDGLFRWG